MEKTKVAKDLTLRWPRWPHLPCHPQTSHIANKKLQPILHGCQYCAELHTHATHCTVYNSNFQAHVEVILYCCSPTFSSKVQQLALSSRQGSSSIHWIKVDPGTFLQCAPECDVPVPGIFHFVGGIGTGIATNWYRKKVSEPVSEKFGTGKKSRNRYRKNLVPGKSLGTGIGKIWYRN